VDISVVIPTYNRYNFLKRAIKSVLNQTFKAKEIIVVDDGSDDNTYKIKDEFKDIKYIYYNENMGVSFARNIGILNAKYDYVAFLDSDDEWHKDKLKEQVDFLKKK
jgi:glycosyltransferase involved in cell wall biosynthesis